MIYMTNAEIQQYIKEWMAKLFDEDVTANDVKNAINKVVEKIIAKKIITGNINRDEVDSILNVIREELV